MVQRSTNVLVVLECFLRCTVQSGLRQKVKLAVFCWYELKLTQLFQYSCILCILLFVISRYGWLKAICWLVTGTVNIMHGMWHCAQATSRSSTICLLSLVQSKKDDCNFCTSFKNSSVGEKANNQSEYDAHHARKERVRQLKKSTGSWQSQNRSMFELSHLIYSKFYQAHPCQSVHCTISECL